MSSSVQFSTAAFFEDLAVHADVAELVDDQSDAAPALFSIRLRISVVFPAPRKPVTTVAGILWVWVMAAIVSRYPVDVVDLPISIGEARPKLVADSGATENESPCAGEIPERGRDGGADDSGCGDETEARALPRMHDAIDERLRARNDLDEAFAAFGLPIGKTLAGKRDFRIKLAFKDPKFCSMSAGADSICGA